MRPCVPFPRQGIYWLLTIPMILIYILTAVFLWQVKPLFFFIYLAMFILVAIFQGYVCVHWRCPYVGKFAPCVGGFCLPSSRIAKLFKNVKRSEKTYNVMVTIAFANFLGIILFPMFFFYQASLWLLLGYIAIVLIYAALFLWLVCPVCATNKVCPGGQTAVAIRKKLGK